MDVKRIALLGLIFLAACEKTKTVNSVTENPQKLSGDVTRCGQLPANQIKTSFLVQWEDGRVTVEKSENMELFKQKFIKPHLEDIKHVEYDSIIKLDDRELSPSTSSEVPNWGQTMIQASSAWNQGIKGQGVLVAIVDTAVDYDHPLYKDQMVEGWDFYHDLQRSPVPHDHATHIAGIIGGGAKVGAPVKGIAPLAKMMSVSFLGPGDEGGTTGDGILALQYAADHGAKIINNSWGGSHCSMSMRAVMESMESKGILLLVAAGNEGDDIEVYPSYPAAFNLPNQITVAANDIRDKMASFSNDSWHLVHLSAPGVGIFSSIAGGRYDYMDGTSMATPFLSGAAALLASLRPQATPAQLRQALLSSVDVGEYRVSTQGRLNVEKALSEIKKLVP